MHTIWMVEERKGEGLMESLTSSLIFLFKQNYLCHTFNPLPQPQFSPFIPPPQLLRLSACSAYVPPSPHLASVHSSALQFSLLCV